MNKNNTALENASLLSLRKMLLFTMQAMAIGMSICVCIQIGAYLVI